MSDIDDQAVDALRRQYLTITGHYEALRGRCTGEGQIGQLNAAYQTAFSNYLAVQNDIFDKNAAAVAALVQAVDAAGTEIDAALQRGQEIVSTLDMLTAWVKTGTGILALVQ